MIWTLSKDKEVIVDQNQIQKEVSISVVIRNLKKLFDEGILTNEKIAKEKKKLLDK